MRTQSSPWLLSSPLLLASLAAAQTTTRASVDSNGHEPDHSNNSPRLTPDGRYVVFVTTATNLFPGDTNDDGDVVVHDRWTGISACASRASSGAQANDYSAAPSITSDGRFVAFHSTADNLTAGDVNGTYDVFVRDLESQTTVCASLTSSGLPSPDTPSSWPTISADGRFVVFTSRVAFDALDGNGATDVYRRDLQGGAVALVSATPGGAAGNAPSLAGAHALSGDGGRAAYVSSASDLVPGDGNGHPDAFVRDLASDATYCASLSLLGVPAASGVLDGFAALSEDGRWVLFASASNDLVPGDTNGVQDVFVRDLELAQTTRVSIGTGGIEPNDVSYARAISDDGRLVLFDSLATNLDGDTPGYGDGFLHDRVTGTTQWLTASAGAQVYPLVNLSDLSPDGRWVAFASYFPLTPGEVYVDPLYDVYVQDRVKSVPLSTYCTAKVNSLGCLPRIGASGAPVLSESDAFRITAHDVRNDKFGLLFWSAHPASIPFHGGFLCADPPITRTPIQLSGSPGGSNCAGFYTFHFSWAYMQSEGLVAGSTVFAQYWSRDPGFAPPDNMGLSAGLWFVVTP